VIGAIYVVDAVREKPGFVVWSVDADTGTWHGSLNDAREINLQGTGGMAPGAAAAFASLGPPPSGFFDTMARGKLYRGQQDVAMSVYGPGGTGVHLLDYPERMFDTIDADFSGIDAYDVAAVAAAMFAGMDAKKLTFSGTSNITKADRAGQEHTQTPVEVTPVLVEKWRQLGRDGGSWRCQRIGGTAFHMPAPV
jgi:hypothetical protein